MRPGQHSRGGKGIISSDLPADVSSRMSRALAEFRRRRREGGLTAAWLDGQAREAAEAFLAFHHAAGGYLAEAITLLCEMATLDEAELARPGVQGLFPFLVERLSDAFDPRYCGLYDRLFVQVVGFCRRLTQGKPLDEALGRFGLGHDADLLRRKERLRAWRRLPEPGREAVAKVLFLSRITLGADVAVTSVCMAGAKAAFPGAELVLLGLPGMAGLFAADKRVRVHQVAYDRGGDLLGRLNAWLDVLAAVEGEIAGLGPGEYLVIDPDSRLTQLGIFPVVADESRYFFFESRGYRVPGTEPISRLTAHWLDQCLGSGPGLEPYVATAEADLEAGRRLRARLRAGGAARLALVNYGVGGNERKRLGDAFEAALLQRLVSLGWTVILAKGVGPEVARADQLADAMRRAGLAVQEADQGEEALSADLLTWQGGIGAYGGLIAASDVYLGYDSAGQHIAAALGVPTVDMFADQRYPMVARRWRPCGPGPVQVVDVGTAEDPLAQVLGAVARLETGI